MERSSYVTFVALSCFAPFSAALYDDKSDVINLTNANFKDKVLKSKEVWLVEFFAPWCAHCQKLAPEYSKAAAELKGTVNFGAVNCDNERNLAEQLSITGYPTIKIYGLDKTAPTEYQSMRTAEALKVAALDALNELMEGKEKKKKKKEPKVVMDIESDKATKDADDLTKVKVETEKLKATKKKEPAEKKDSEPSEGTKDAETAKGSNEPTDEEDSELSKEIKDSERATGSESLSDDSKKEPAKDKKTESSEDSKEPGSPNTESRKGTVKKKETESLQDTKETEKSTKGTEKGPAKQGETKSTEKLKDTESSSKEPAADEKVTDDSQQPAKDKAPKESLTDQQSQEDVSPKKAEQEVKKPNESSEETEQPKKDDTESIPATEEPKPTESTSATEESKPTESAVVILTDENFNDTVIQSEEPWLVEFYVPWCKHCQKFASTYEKIAGNLKGQVSVGSYDCDAEEVISKIYSIGNFPTLKLFPPGSKEPSDVLTYELTDLTEPAIGKWISSELSQAIPAPNISQLTDQSIFDEACTSVQLCVISFLPHILDCNAACRNDYLKILKKLGDKYKKTQWGWLWVEAGAQQNLEAVLDIGGAGYPAMAAVSTKKTRYASLRGAFSFAGIDKFLEALYMGGESTAPIKGDLPKIRKNEEWDGKDGKMPNEDEDDHQHEEL